MKLFYLRAHSGSIEAEGWFLGFDGLLYLKCKFLLEKLHLKIYYKLFSCITVIIIFYKQFYYSSHIFKLTEVEDLVKEIKNDLDILRFAISFEKDSIVIFQEFKNASNKAGAEILEKLINEEKGHIKKISELFQSM